jgi:hypothetical protein
MSSSWLNDLRREGKKDQIERAGCWMRMLLHTRVALLVEEEKGLGFVCPWSVLCTQVS